MKYYIIVRNNKIINAGLEYELETVLDNYTIEENKTYRNTALGGEHEVLYIYTE